MMKKLHENHWKANFTLAIFVYVLKETKGYNTSQHVSNFPCVPYHID